MGEMTREEALRELRRAQGAMIVSGRTDAADQWKRMDAALDALEAFSTPAGTGEVDRLSVLMGNWLEKDHYSGDEAAEEAAEFVGDARRTLRTLTARVEALEAGLREIERLYYVEGQDASWRAAHMNGIARALLAEKDGSDDSG